MDLQPLPLNLLSLGCPSQSIKAIAREWRVLPSVSDMRGLAETLKAYPVAVTIMGQEWPHADRVAACDLISCHAGACAFLGDDTPESMQTAIMAALAERSEQVDSILLKQLIHIIPDPVFFKDRNGRFLATNPAIARHFRVDDPALLIGRSDFDFFAPAHAQAAYADEMEVMRTDRPIAAKLEKETYDEGNPTWCLTWKAPLHDKAGRIIGTFGFSRDVTELKTTEEALATKRGLLDVLLAGIPDPVFIKDRESRFLLANPAIAKMMGSTPAGLCGKRDADFCPPEMAAEYRGDEEEVMETGLPMINREERVMTADGRELWFLTSKLPYRNPQGEIMGIIGIARNITLRKSFDDQLKIAQAEIVALRAELGALKGTT